MATPFLLSATLPGEVHGRLTRDAGALQEPRSSIDPRLRRTRPPSSPAFYEITFNGNHWPEGSETTLFRRGFRSFFFLKKKKKRDKIEDTQDSRNREGNKKEFVGAKRTYNTGYSLVVTDPTTNPALTGLSRGERTGSRVLQWIWSYVLDAGTALCFVPHNRGRAKSC